MHAWLQLGVYNEVSLQRLDLILAEAGKNGVRVIFPFVNYWPDLGGMQWYVDQVHTQFLPNPPQKGYAQRGQKGYSGLNRSRDFAAGRSA